MTHSHDAVVICDDVAERRQAWMEAIALQVSHLSVVGLDKEAFRENLDVLDARRREAREHPMEAGLGGDCLFDRAAILLVDFDLIDFDESVTGEMVAYLARCYSKCALIVGLNQFGEGPFDLTLVGHPDSFADVNVGGRQLSNPGLWKEPFAGFRPWSWPLLRSAVEALEVRGVGLVDHLDEGVLDYFGLGEKAAQIPRSTKEFLGVNQKAEEVTFESFVRRSGNGLHRKDGPVDREMISRIAAARLHKWLERLVLAGQDLVVDAPHLALRFPSLVRGDRANSDSWNACATLDNPDLNSNFNTEVISEFEFVRPVWLSRPSWYWFKARESPQIREVARPWKGDEPYVFCEDVSRFLERNATREFVADVPSAYVRRFALDPGSEGGRAFLQQERAKEQWDDEATDPTEMEYRPAVRFAL